MVYYVRGVAYIGGVLPASVVWDGVRGSEYTVWTGLVVAGPEACPA